MRVIGSDLINTLFQIYYNVVHIMLLQESFLQNCQAVIDCCEH